MNKYKSSRDNSFQIISPILLTGYLCLGFIPNLEAVDKIAPQWVCMTLLNLLSIVIFYSYRKFISNSVRYTLRSSISLTYIAFIFWAGFSFFYAINPTEVLVNITRQANVLMMFLSMAILLYSMKKNRQIIPWIITSILCIELYAVFVEAMEMINSSGQINPGFLKGVTANRNITAFSIAIKIPFVIFLIYRFSKAKVKLLLSSIVFLSFLSLTMIQSRASFIAIGLILISYIILQIFLLNNNKKRVLQILQLGYIVLPLILAIVINQTFFADKGADALSRAATISISTEDGSVNQRLRYYEDVLTHLKSNPIFGTGLGNWKIKSIDYDSNDIVGYIVPYHAHSDFIQLGAELGIIGFLLYLGIFLWAVYFVFILIRHSKIELEGKVFLFLLITALGVYSIDANLNFPIARPQVLVVWSLIMALILVYYQKFLYQEKKVNYKTNLNSAFFGFSIAILLPSLYITNTVYKSLKGQMILLQDFNSNQYNLPLNQVENIVPEIPNITVTTIPINSVKARYFFNAKKYNKAMAYIEKGTNANPYLFYSEILKSQIFEQQGKLDSAKYYAKKAFFGLPNNELHSTRYMNLLNITGDRKSLDEAFDLLTKNNSFINWKNYLIIASNSKRKTKDIDLIEKAKLALDIFPGNGEIKSLYNKIIIGDDALNQAVNFSNKGLEFFNNKDYAKAAIEFEKAAALNPLDYANLENAATANYLINKLDKALEQIDKVIDELNPLNGKCEYIKALIFIKMQDPIGACPLLETSIKSGFSQSESLLNQYCNY
ncbi:MAG: O-antigen ligase family protein [Flavobacteriaceae bacterium]